jgi:hypothetical protein
LTFAILEFDEFDEERSNPVDDDGAARAPRVEDVLRIEVRDVGGKTGGRSLAFVILGTATGGGGADGRSEFEF